MSSIRKVDRIPTAIQVVNSVREAIQSGLYKVGDKLPNETELARQTGTGRSSIREGMRILASYGIVEIKQGEGTFVADNSAEQIFEFIGYQPDSQNIVYLSQLRHVFEVGCVSIICEKGLSEAQYQELASLVGGLKVAKDSSTTIAMDAAFHKKLFAYTGNPLLIQIYHMVSKLMNSLMSKLMCREDVRRDAQCAHQSILEALRQGDKELSMAAMENHLNTVDGYVERYILSASQHRAHQ